MTNFEFYSPWFLLLFLLFIPLLIRDFSREKASEGIRVPSISGMGEKKYFGVVIFLLRWSKYLALSAMIIALARPRTFSISSLQDDSKGIDIMLTVDTSLSMLSRDLDPDRLTALQQIAINFVKNRPSDRIGLVTYAAEGITKVPVTIDHQVLMDEIQNINPFELTAGTAIGEGLSVAVSHIRNSKAKSKIIILMTDGVNTIQNAMPPQVAAEIAADNNIKVYTIGIGTNGYALMPTRTDIFGDLVFTEEEVKIDEDALQEIAHRTGGKYFRATSNASLEGIYDEINRLEKSDVKTEKIYNYSEHFRGLLVFAFVIFVLDAFLRWRIFRIIN